MAANTKKPEERATVTANLDFGKVKISLTMEDMKLTDRMKLQRGLLGLLIGELDATAKAKKITL